MVISEKGKEEKMSPEDDLAVWDAFEKLSQEKKDTLLSGEVPQKIKSLQEKLELSDLVVGNISLIIRKIFFEEFSLSEAEEKIGALLVSGGGSADKAKNIIGYIQQEILTIKPKPKMEAVEVEDEQPKPVMVRMPLLQALSKYEQLGNQLITRERIRIKSQTEPVRPSLLYWIKYYRDELGVGHHDSVQRGNFLFRSENGKRLSSEERERVNLVLKSVEENFPVEVDTEQSVIIFPPFVPQPAAARASQMPPLAPKRAPFQPEANAAFQFGKASTNGVSQAHQDTAQPGALSFSSSHVFPAEKAGGAEKSVAPRPAPAPVETPAPSSHTSPASKSNPFHIRPVSLGKTDEE